jgi:hypothetical protein
MNTQETPLSVNQRIELLERVTELVQYDIENERNSDLDDIINDVADTFVSPYYTEQVQQWVDMGTPEPEDWTIEPENQNPTHTLITWAIIETVREYLYNIIFNTDTTGEEAAEAIRDELEYLRKAVGYATLAQAIIK